MATSSFKSNPAGLAAFRRALGFGMLNYGLAVQAAAQRHAPVLTGNLRRSLHTAAFNDGVRFYGGTDTNGKPIPDYVAKKGITVIVGTNCGYGVYQELGTRRMLAQPYLGPGLAETRPQAAQLIKAGMERVAPGSTG